MMRTAICAAVIVAASVIALHPAVDTSHEALIVNTTISSSIIDAKGVAIAVAPYSCGIDTSFWCDTASSISNNQ